jgi:hypothetical protein
MEKSPVCGFRSIAEFESSIHKRLRPMQVTHGLNIQLHKPIKVRNANTFFARDRSWRCTFLCGVLSEYVLVEARLDFNPLWLMQLEMLAAYNPAALQRLIVVCPNDAEVLPSMARLTVVRPEYLIDRVVAGLNLN